MNLNFPDLSKVEFAPTRVEVKSTEYLFVDGQCLQHAIRDIEQDLDVSINFSYKKLGAGFKRVFYYDCLPRQKKDESEQDYLERIKPIQTRHDHLRSLPGFHVFEGEVRRSSISKRTEQKKVDTMIAVDMLMHSFRQNMDSATLITNDLDFKPVLDALVQIGMYVMLWHRTSNIVSELTHSADHSLPLTYEFMKDWIIEPRLVHKVENSLRQLAFDNQDSFVASGILGEARVTLHKADEDLQYWLVKNHGPHNQFYSGYQITAKEENIFAFVKFAIGDVRWENKTI